MGRHRIPDMWRKIQPEFNYFRICPFLSFRFRSRQVYAESNIANTMCHLRQLTQQHNTRCKHSLYSSLASIHIVLSRCHRDGRSMEYHGCQAGEGEQSTHHCHHSKAIVEQRFCSNTSIAVQQGNAVSFRNTIMNEWIRRCSRYTLFINFMPAALCPLALK